MRAGLDPRTNPEGEEGRDEGKKKVYVEPQVTKEEVLPDITGDPTVTGSPPWDENSGGTG